VQVLLDLN
jgi:pyruvate/2-oxoglutarate dehydrogenase complex dihydrolipoamide dehydrogenase (E3) component